LREEALRVIAAVVIKALKRMITPPSSTIHQLFSRQHHNLPLLCSIHLSDPDPLKKEFAVCGIFEKLETLVSHYQENDRLRILFECDNPDLKVHADEQMITQVLLNLVKNASQAVEGQEEAEISSSAVSYENRIVLKVTDNGEGIPPEISDEIFMPFFTTRKKGTGVGLSYSRQVMAMNGGRIEFDSQPGRTRFRLVF
jgi:two-component system nitrogen regulation sensor histidine kinase NtrY